MSANSRIVFSSDLHGNLLQYQKLIALARNEKADVVIIGGDLFPKGKYEGIKTKTVEAQKKYFVENIIPIVREFDGHVYFTFGNADFIQNVAYFRNYLSQQIEKLPRIHVIDSEVVKISSSNLHLFGYGGVPWTRHHLKDWERFDTENPEEHKTRDLAYLTTQGAVSYSDEDFVELTGSTESLLSKFVVPEHEEKVIAKYGPTVRHVHFPDVDTSIMKSYSIENQIRRSLIKNGIQPNDEKNKSMIWVIHGPPLNSNLDLLKSNVHCGSLAVRRLIEEYKPLITFHGHIHETVDMSGSYKDNVGESVSFSAGNYPSKENLAAIVLDTSNPSSATRVII
jgi:Icc-related predicted phosphoesterase